MQEPMPSDDFVAEGRCVCGAVRYRLEARPLFVQCCHCRWCQRETGTAFTLNAMIEAGKVTLLRGALETVHTPSNSGKGQKIVRCPRCRVAAWSHYAGAGDAVCFVRVGTLDKPDRLPPGIHIFTESKQPWVLLPPAMPAVARYYDREKHWLRESMERFAQLKSARKAPEQSSASGCAGARNLARHRSPFGGPRRNQRSSNPLS